MIARRPTLGASRFASFIENYRTERCPPDRRALDLLDRLRASRDARRVFERLNVQSVDEALPILEGCVVAEMTARTFVDRMATEEEMLGRLMRLSRCVSELDRFISDQSRESHHPIEGWLAFRDPDGSLTLEMGKQAQFAAMKEGLELTSALIEGRRQSAIDTQKALSANRKRRLPNASTKAAIRVLGRWIRRTTGRAHTKEVNDLIEIILEVALTPHQARTR